MPHKLKIHVTIEWTLVTQNTHVCTLNIIWSHLLTLLATVCLIVCDYIPKTNLLCVTKYYKRPHKHKINVAIGWSIVTQNTHFFLLNSIWSHLLTFLATCCLIVCDQIPKTNMRCVTKYHKRPHKHKIHVAIWWSIVTQNTHLFTLKSIWSHLLTLLATLF